MPRKRTAKSYRKKGGTKYLDMPAKPGVERSLRADKILKGSGGYTITAYRKWATNKFGTKMGNKMANDVKKMNAAAEAKRKKK